MHEVGSTLTGRIQTRKCEFSTGISNSSDTSPGSSRLSCGPQELLRQAACFTSFAARLCFFSLATGVSNLASTRTVCRRTLKWARVRCSPPQIKSCRLSFAFTWASDERHDPVSGAPSLCGRPPHTILAQQQCMAALHARRLKETVCLAWRVGLPLEFPLNVPWIQSDALIVVPL